MYLYFAFSIVLCPFLILPVSFFYHFLSVGNTFSFPLLEIVFIFLLFLKNNSFGGRITVASSFLSELKGYYTTFLLSSMVSMRNLMSFELVSSYGSGPQPFWHQGPVSWKTILPWTRGGGDGFKMSQVHYIYCALYFYYYYIVIYNEIITQLTIM